MSKRIYLSSPDVSVAEEEALVRAIRSGWVAPLGPEVDAFESELAERCRRAHAVALSSGTAALHLGLLNLGVRPRDVVITATMTFVATANAVTYVNAHPVFVDCDASGNMNPELLRTAIEDQLAQGHRVAAIIPVDLLGKVADYPAIQAVARSYGIPVLSDAAESLGARRDGCPAGSHGDMAAISFNGNKIMTTSGGGALLTDDADVAARTRYLATQARQPAVHYEHSEIGFNYRMSNLLAALGRAQLSRLGAMIDRRKSLRQRYRDLFAQVPGVQMFGQPDGSDGGGTVDNFWLTSILVDPVVAGWNRDDLTRGLAREDIEARPLWKPMHRQPVFRDSAFYACHEPVADMLFSYGLSLPSGSVLTEQDWLRVSSAIEGFLGRVSEVEV